ncbi:hypothetical protein LOD99_6098 [Oopsacas minuta]|uniref:Major facilitator superfamily (MFS) profile domain-containing protein n=1 Tax=Oopsacas minuta TaxID=111878 RepID=A0AAV7JN08_9METZ|nr:hypothetical protein LOD99_6098 [Oopsacas minuta]
MDTHYQGSDQSVSAHSNDSIPENSDEIKLLTEDTNVIQGCEHTANTDLKVKSTWFRLYILFLFSSLCFLQNLFVNTWGPMADSVEIALNRNDQGTTVAWLSNSAAIAYIPGVVIFYLIINHLGLRFGVVVATLLVCLCGILRCFIFSTSSIFGTSLLFFAQFLNGLAGPVVVSATTQLSANWFPSNERNIATAISGQSSNIGISISFILGPLLVPDVNTSSFISSSTKSVITNSILHLLYIEAVAAVLLFILIVLYFPSRPKSAPSVSATVDRLNFVSTIKSYSRNYPLILLSLCYAIPVGVNTGWYGFLYPNLRKLSVHVSQNYVGWLGFYMSTAGAFSAVFFSTIAGCFPRRKKLLVVTLFISASILLAFFSFICLDIIQIGDNIYKLLTITGITCGIFLSAVDPILKELIVEVGFPIAEFNSTLTASLIFDIIMILFFGIASLSFLGTTWINWFQLAVYIASAFMILLTPIKLHRLDRDTSY